MKPYTVKAFVGYVHNYGGYYFQVVFRTRHMYVTLMFALVEGANISINVGSLYRIWVSKVYGEIDFGTSAVTKHIEELPGMVSIADSERDIQVSKDRDLFCFDGIPLFSYKSKMEKPTFRKRTYYRDLRVDHHGRTIEKKITVFLGDMEINYMTRSGFVGEMLLFRYGTKPNKIFCTQGFDQRDYDEDVSE